ncbi:glycoside hydrolase family 24 protein [Duganella qianjiadongensis]|uniref:Glycoside hydrolase family protein n=1 Tax=Duganella qianjiadongensis TaxID=2692176 RepID=A0ABW9VPP7_9BURK|nr:glycoside hydrolase family 104 protein [Duganella qianjiadongensis]MYM39662.1 glycoside hydrolase family protein [Duganella qianjiadongensis]
MSTVTNLVTSVTDAVDDPQVQAFLALIRVGEGTTGPNGYRTMFGGGLFVSYTDHPRQLNRRNGITSSAAGAYQFLSGTWDEMRNKYDLSNFGPECQDIAAVGLIKRRGALADVLAGRFRSAIDKCNKEWASLPGSPYGQPTLTYARAESVLVSAGAQITEAIA